ncbi:MAG: 4-hydroxy-3-methylbut-2-enyl diphosphate reductase [Firmicutes bacterium]|nr:4-hydroxy-3-methylbut-2-enyl diphosphate reductase [Bacillota bacterium]
MEIFVAKTAGFCFGVKRALEMALTALEETDSSRRSASWGSAGLYSLGPLIHNSRVVAELAEKGLKVINDLGEITGGKVVIRSHGVGPQVYQEAAARQIELIDATCPFVKNTQQLAGLLKEQDYQVIIFGESDHAEVKGVLDSIGQAALVISRAGEIDGVNLGPKVGVISQTTQDLNDFQRIIAGLINHTKELRVFNTICSATAKRQEEAAALSRQVGLMIVVGGKNSANTSRLVGISRNNHTMTVQVESAGELKAEWFKGVERVGVTAGASTPDEHIQEVVAQIKYLGGRIDSGE